MSPGARVTSARRTGIGYGPWRRGVQGAFAFLFLVLPFAGGSAVGGTLVALRLGRADLVEPATALSAALAAHGAPWTLLMAALPLLVLAAVLGPVYCSWACPFGLLSELRDRLRPAASRRWSGHPARGVHQARAAVLVLWLAASPALGFPLAALLAPPRLLTVLPVELRAARGWPVVTAVLLAAILVLELAGPRRLVCRVLCPVGTVAALLRRRFTLAPRWDAPRCRCAEIAPCLQACPWGVDPRCSGRLEGCTTCLACLDRCPTRALTLRRGPAPS